MAHVEVAGHDGLQPTSEDAVFFDLLLASTPRGTEWQAMVTEFPANTCREISANRWRKSATVAFFMVEKHLGIEFGQGG